VWRKTSRSGNATTECVEVADGGDVVGVRDSKDPHGPVLEFDRAQWAAFVAGVKAGSFDR
jgi:hypothetical protein